MTPHQALALGVRLFAVWYALALLRELSGFLVMRRPPLDSQELTAITVGIVLSIIALLALWFFPKSIARGLLPNPTEASTQPLSYQMWFALGTALIGLWFVASSITPILRNVSVMYVFRPELVNSEDVRQLRVSLVYYAIEVALGLFLLLGATGISRLIWRIRNAVPD